jgi:hypothetical protein
VGISYDELMEKADALHAVKKYAEAISALN